MALPRTGNTKDKRRKACWLSQELSALRAEATKGRRRFLKARRSEDQRRIQLCLEARRETKKLLKRDIWKSKVMAWREFVGTLEADTAQDLRGVQVDGAAVTLEEVLAAAKKIAGGKAPGPDGVPGIVIRAVAGHCGVGLAEHFTECFRTSNFPTAWKRARLVLIKKKQDAQLELPGSYRPICLLD
ncbi:hypothetical protein M0804_014592 [Polistes exclamans]|nr:hypothetical protein M0804_014592 [Polistes exclamans]